MDSPGSVVVEDGVIRDVIPAPASPPEGGALVIDGSCREPGGSDDPSGSLVLMPALVDLHAHLREPGEPAKETVEAAALAAAAGGYGTVVCMANTKPPLDTVDRAAFIKTRCDRLGLIDLYPVLSLTRSMEGRELSEIRALPSAVYTPRLLSEDGRDVGDDGLFLDALAEGRRLALPVSCHCDFGGAEAEDAKKAGEPRSVWSRLEENHGVRRAIGLGAKAGAHIHIAHVSTAESVELIRQAKASLGETAGPFTLSCEAVPHHIALTEEAAKALGEESYGRVNPPLRTEADRRALIAGIMDGTIDAIATDHAPHTPEDKSAGAPGFSGLETAFAVCFDELARGEAGRPALRLSRLSALMSAAPARLLGFGGDGPEDRGRIAAGLRADLIIVRVGTAWTVDPRRFKSRGNNSPFGGRKFSAQIILTLQQGRIVYQAF